MSYVYNSNNPPGSRVNYSTIKINGRTLNPSATYTVTAPDGVVPFLNQIPGFSISNLTVTNYFMYNVIKNFIVARSPIAYFSEGRAIDLAPFGQPVSGVTALSDVVGLFDQNGSINNQRAVSILQQILDRAHTRLQNGREYLALIDLCLFKLQVRLQSWARHITPLSADRLVFIAEKLQDAIRDSNPRVAGIDEDNILPEKFELQ